MDGCYGAKTWRRAARRGWAGGLGRAEHCHGGRADRWFCSARVQLALEGLPIPGTEPNPSPGFGFQPVAGFKRWQQRPFHLFSLTENKSSSLQEGDVLVIKTPTAHLLGAQLISATATALTPLSFAFSLWPRVIYILMLCSEPPRPGIADKRAPWVSTSPGWDASQQRLLCDTGAALPIKSPVPSLGQQSQPKQILSEEAQLISEREARPQFRENDPRRV